MIRCDLCGKEHDDSLGINVCEIRMGLPNDEDDLNDEATIGEMHLCSENCVGNAQKQLSELINGIKKASKPE